MIPQTVVYGKFRLHNQAVADARPIDVKGKVVQVVGTIIKASVPGVKMGEVCILRNPWEGTEVQAEVVGFTKETVLLTALGGMVGISAQTEVIPTRRVHMVPVGDSLLGRVLDGLGRPIDSDEKGPLRPDGYYPVYADPPNPLERTVISKPISLGVRSLDGLLTCGEGQRMGIFAAAGGGKSTLLAQKKLRDARNKGQVCTSKDIVSTALLILGFCLCAALGVVLVDDFTDLISYIAATINEPSISSPRESGKLALVMICKHSFIFVLCAAAVGIGANTVQIGFLFTLEPLKPDMNKLNPVEGAKKIFAKKNLFEFLKNTVKVVFLGYLLWKIIWASVPELLTLCYGTIDDIFPCVSLMLKRLACYTAFGYIVIAAVDRIFQGRDYTKQMMMTKDEVKREYKEMEGSAEVKQAQRQFRDEILNGPEPAKATRDADVVVTNPTHLAIGIRYRAEEAPLPKIVVAGADRIAKIIRETALEEGIPIMEDISLARRLYALGKVEDYIPPELVEPVAEVLKWVKRLEQARREERELDEIEI